MDPCSLAIEIDDLRITNMPNSGIWLDNSHHIILSNGETDHNGRLAGWNASGIDVSTGNSYISIENWDSHHNISALPDGSGMILDNADGYSLNVTGPGIQIVHSRAWRNSDDGIDTFFSNQPATFTGNWVFENGYLDEDGLPATTSSGPSAENPTYSGDGNGIKLGGGASGSDAAAANHWVSNNLVWGNRVGGVADNNHDGPLTVYNNTSYNNGTAGDAHSYDFSFWDNDPTFKATVRNNLAFSPIGVGMNMNGADDQFNSWNFLGISVSAGDFVTLDDSMNRGSRQADGSLPVSDFLHLVEGSDPIDIGIDVGLPFNGSAPDLGAFELSGEPPSSDFDFDGDIDSGDFLAWQRGFGTPAPTAAKSDGDSDNDRDVDNDDLAIWQNQFGTILAGTTTALAVSFALAQEGLLETAQVVPEDQSGDLVDLALVHSLFQDGAFRTAVGRDSRIIERALEMMDGLRVQGVSFGSDEATSAVFDELGNDLNDALSPLMPRFNATVS